MLHLCGIDSRWFFLWGLGRTCELELVEICATFVSGQLVSARNINPTRPMTKETSVAVIYHCDRLSEKVIRNRQKLQRRLQRAIEDMVEDGFLNFILPLDERSPFPTSFIDAIIAEKSHNHNIRLTIMLPYEIEECFSVTPAERLKAHTQYADQIIYNQKEYICGEPTNQVENLLDRSAALIIYYEKNCSQLSYITHQAQHGRRPLININI